MLSNDTKFQAKAIAILLLWHTIEAECIVLMVYVDEDIDSSMVLTSSDILSQHSQHIKPDIGTLWKLKEPTTAWKVGTTSVKSILAVVGKWVYAKLKGELMGTSD